MKTERAARRSRVVLAVAAGVSGVVTVALLLWRPSVALGYLGGVLTGAGMLSALVYVLNRLIVPPEQRTAPVWPLALLHAGKLGLAMVIAFVVILVWEGSAVGFALGYTTALITLVAISGLRPVSSPAQ
ncbi:MAG: hypothetical protein ACOX9R_07590 [Armatimonadota bacterium]|jgi:hypothetical protein